MNSTNALPAKLDRAVCCHCRIDSPVAMLVIRVGENPHCRNRVACMKRQQRIKPTATRAPDAPAIEPAPPAKRSRVSKRRADE